MKRDRSGTGSIPSARASAAVPPGSGTSSVTPAAAAGRSGGNTATIVMNDSRSSQDLKGGHYIHGIRKLHRQRHYRSGGSRAGQETSRNVHRGRRLSWPAPPRLGSARQRRRRGDER